MRWNQVEVSLAKKLKEAEPLRYGDISSYTGGGGLGQAFGAVNAMINDPQGFRDAQQDAATGTGGIGSGIGGGIGGGATGGTAGAGDATAGAGGTGDAQGSAGGAGVSASSDLITMLKGFEGYGEKVNPSQGNRSNVRPYWDHAQWSIGYGSYAGSRNRNQRPNVEWTPAQAEQQLRSQLRPYRNNVESINRRGRYQWGAAQLDALTSFAYNIGSINQLTANGTRSNREIADKMLEYTRASGRRISGLVNRRRIERQKFLSGMSQTQLDYRPGRRT